MSERLVEEKKVGRPPLYNSPQELQNKIDEYFQGGVNVKKVACRKGKNTVIEKIPIPTITGLALYLGFSSRQSFYAYEAKEEFSYIIKRGRARIEQVYEEQLHTNSPTGAIFALKNFDWKDTPMIQINRYVQFYRPEARAKKDLEAALRPTRRSV